ncbi:hypothetical protein HPB50_016366 [Hyalomma asiaticum]|uniref:Uncharacterized protein n=1 Tax=Hyalomma asiaticum TaxID=266040 RepID=A0ACB7SND1_HYAAI|nr:hypothetical protein HPB50_016366 [Hyalomma asiaticum]
MDDCFDRLMFKNRPGIQTAGSIFFTMNSVLVMVFLFSVLTAEDAAVQLKLNSIDSSPAACNTVFYAVDEEDEPEERHPPCKVQAEKSADTTEEEKHISIQQPEDACRGSSSQSSVTS